MISRILSMSLLNFATRVFMAVLVLITQVVISRHYLVQDLAVYSKLINYINIATVATGLGLNISAIFHLRKQLLPIRYVYRISSSFFFILGIVVFLVLYSAGVPAMQALLIAIYSFLNNLFFLHNAKAQAQTDFPALNLQNIIYAMVNIVAIAAIYFSSSSIPVGNIIALQCVYLGIVNLLFVYQPFFKGENKRLSNDQPRAFLGYGIKIFFTNMLGILLYSGDIILLDLFLADDALAVYLLAATAIKFLWLAIDSVGLVIFPEFVKPAENSSVLKQFNKLFLMMAVLLVAALVVFFFTGRWLLETIYGPQFPQLFELVLLLMVATFGVMFYKFLSRYFAAAEQWTPIYFSLLAGIAADVILIYWLVPLYGVTGAAYASVGAYLLTGMLIGIWYLSGTKKYKPILS